MKKRPLDFVNGLKKKMAKEPSRPGLRRDVVVSLQMPKGELENLQLVAAVTGKPMGEIIRTAVQNVLKPE